MKHITVELEEWIREEILMCRANLASINDIEIRGQWHTRKMALESVLEKAGCEV
jgi:hypothetical protein